MGAVKRDIHKLERRFEDINLSELDVVKWLIMYRDKVDTYKDAQINRDIDVAGDIDDFNVSLINLYIHLDSMIEKANLNEGQKALINLLSIGYTQEEIAEILKSTQQSVSKKFDTICSKIVETNNYYWKLYVHKNILGTQLKVCSKCKESMPANESFFRKDNSKKDGFKTSCKKCK